MNFFRGLPTGDFEVVFRWERGEFGMWFGLIPEGCGGDVGFLVIVSSVVTPAEILYGDPEVFVEPDRVEDMPTV